MLHVYKYIYNAINYLIQVLSYVAYFLGIDQITSTTKFERWTVCLIDGSFAR